MTKISEMTIENIIEEELSELPLPDKPQKIQNIGNHILITGLPIIPLAKFEHLKNVIKSVIKCEEVYIPNNPDDQSKGYVFVRYPTEDMAALALKQFNGVEFDRKHVFNFIMLSEYNQLMEGDISVEIQPQAWRYQSDMSSWLLQRQCRDQLLVHSKSDVNIYEHSCRNLETKWSKSDFTDSIVLWSPLGTYMATIHDLGIALWGGSNFVQINRFKHPKVRHVLFSPNEKYMITFSLSKQNCIVNVWNVLTGLILREFIIPKSEEEDQSQYWPEFRWSFDDMYFARKQKDKISVYLSQNCVMIDKKSIDIVGLKDFTWSARGHLISYWASEQENAPIRIVLINLPSKREVCTKTLFNIANVSLKWSSQDDFLAVIGDRYVKKKFADNQWKYIGLSASLEIYRIKEKEIPVEKIAVGDKTQIVANDWENNGSRFAILTCNQRTTNLLIFDLKVLGQTQKNMDYTFSTRMTMLKWSPAGQFLACTTPNTSTIEFVDGHDGTVLKRVEAQSLNDLAWDPTGRFLLSYRLSLLNDSSECTVSFHSITGRTLMEKSFPGLKQIMWRPRPPCLLTENEIKNIKKNMNKYNHQFAHQDEMMSNETKRKLMERRQQLMADWLTMRTKVTVLFNNEKTIRIGLRSNTDTDNLEHGKCKEQIYVLVSSKVEILSH